MDGFTVTTFDLSLTNSETGNPLVANLYHVDGISRALSIAELVMAICLQKATEIESAIIARMEAQSKMTVNLESLTEIQAALTAKMTPPNAQTDGLETVAQLRKLAQAFDVSLIWYKEDGTLVRGKQGQKTYAEIETFLKSTAEVKIDSGMTTIAEVVQAVSSRIDELNTTNQKEMIELQSDVAKRDNRYELITNMLKSIGTMNLNVVSNYK